MIDASNTGNIAAYAYDHKNNRVRTNVNGVTTHALWDEFSAWGNVVRETDGTSGAEIASYVIGVDGTVLSQTRGVNSHYFLTDAQHSTRMLTNDSGAVSDSYAYSAYGELTDSSGSTPNDYR
jgi:hypothetical protein